jgi:hypothetical protein
MGRGSLESLKREHEDQLQVHVRDGHKVRHGWVNQDR